MFEASRKSLEHLRSLARRVAQRAAPFIEAKLRHDATTKRGNVPQFAPGPRGSKWGSVPISARAVGDSIVVSAPDWVLEKARALEQPDDWKALVSEAVDQELKGGS